jgi:3-isopropylmalate/(R)-2-methylmalate dehydratase large subunit
MSMTLTEKILAAHSGKKAVSPGENIWVDVDRLMTHDVCGPATIAIFQEKFGARAKVWDRNRVIIIPDHYIFTEDKHARRNLEILREFAAAQDIPDYYGAFTDRYMGVCHSTLAEKGHNFPGGVLFGTDSHTCTSGAFGMFSTGIGNTDAAFILGTGKLWVKVPETMRFEYQGRFPGYVMGKDVILALIGELGVDGATYRSLEFGGPAVAGLDMEERMTICNMAIECGAKNGIVPADQVTLDYLAARAPGRKHEITQPDADAKYHTRKKYDAAKLVPVVAQPHSPDKVAPAADLKDVRLDRAYLGSCTGGKIADFRAAARVLHGRKTAIETFVVPATVIVERQLKEEQYQGSSLLQIFQEAGCKIGPASCAACLGGPEDTFGRTHGSERVISATNRNFPGRMGSPQSSVWLASPLTVAASAVTGKITDPREML